MGERHILSYKITWQIAINEKKWIPGHKMCLTSSLAERRVSKDSTIFCIARQLHSYQWLMRHYRWVLCGVCFLVFAKMASNCLKKLKEFLKSAFKYGKPDSLLFLSFFLPLNREWWHLQFVWLLLLIIYLSHVLSLITLHYCLCRVSEPVRLYQLLQVSSSSH